MLEESNSLTQMLVKRTVGEFCEFNIQILICFSWLQFTYNQQNVYIRKTFTFSFCVHIIVCFQYIWVIFRLYLTENVPAVSSQLLSHSFYIFRPETREKSKKSSNYRVKLSAGRSFRKCLINTCHVYCVGCFEERVGCHSSTFWWDLDVLQFLFRQWQDYITVTLLTNKNIYAGNKRITTSLCSQLSHYASVRPSLSGGCWRFLSD